MTWEGRLTLEISSAPPDSTPVWVDFTDRVRDAAQLLTWGRGRQNNLDQSEPGPFEAVLDNSDDALTLGNTSSPYFSWWGPGRRLRVREHIGQFTIDQYMGYLQIPEELLITARTEQYVKITAVDRLGRLSAAAPFISTVAAHIMGSSRSGALVAYWPMQDETTRIAAAVGNTQTLTFISGPAGVQIVLAGDHQPQIVPQGADALPGDDRPALRFITGVSNGGNAASPYFQTAIGSATVPAGGSATAVVWHQRDPAALFSGANIMGFYAGALIASLSTVLSGVDQFYRLDVTGAVTGTIDSPAGTAALGGRWQQLGIRLNSTTAFELWVDGVAYPGTLSGTPGSLDPSFIVAAAGGAYGHLQAYAADSASFTLADAQLQRTVALAGLDRQTTGERIRSILQYAGMSSTELSRIDPGTSVMSPAQLAGLDPLSALRQAEVTEQGLLWIDGNGDVVFSDRRRLYNV